MALADDLRNQAKANRQSNSEKVAEILTKKDQIIKSFNYVCHEAASVGKKTCAFHCQGNYDDRLINFYTDDYNAVKMLCSNVQAELEKEGFKRLKVSVSSFNSSETNNRKIFKGLLGRYKYTTSSYYTINIEAKW